MKKSILNVPYYVWLAALFPVLSVSLRNSDQVQPLSILIAIALTLGAATVLLVVARALFGTWHRAGLAGLIFIVAFYGYGPVGAAAEAALLTTPIVLSVVCGLLVLLGFSMASRLPDERCMRAAGPLNVITVALVVITVGQGLYAGNTSRPTAAADSLPIDSGTLQGSPRDIYYIVLDGYARDDVLREHYGFDNASFLSELERIGFSVVKAGNANYYWTFLSLASALNMNYLQDVLNVLQPPMSLNRQPAYDAIRNNAVANFLGAHGYRYVHLQSTWGATHQNPYADSFLSCSESLFANEYFRAIVEASWLRALRARAGTSLADCHLTNFASLKALAAEEGPKFVFAHFVMPHHPYLFDRDGNVLSDATISNQFDFQARLWEDKDGYIEQLMFVNDMLVAVVDAIVASSGTPPIVLIHSDHGPNLAEGLDSQEQLRVRLANFAAYYSPGAETRLIPDGDTPVNYFRRILNEYFDTGLPILDGRQYYSGYSTPFLLEDVTNRLMDHTLEAKR